MFSTTVKPNYRKSNFFFPELENIVNHVFTEAPVANQFRPFVNITEVENNIDIVIAAPGFQKADFKINLEKDLLTISAAKEEAKVEGEKVIRKEFNFSKFERSFHLNEKIDNENIVAHYENGILKVTLTKKPEVKPEIRTINLS
jgi:HSP20 family protein